MFLKMKHLQRGNVVQLQDTSPIRLFPNTPHKTVSDKYSGFPLPGNFFAYLAKNGSAMKRFIFLCSLFIVFLVKAQDSASIPTLHHGTEFIIKVVTAEDGLYSNSIVHEKKIGSKILISTSAPFLKRQIPDDEVRGQFGTIKSEKGTRTLLRIKSGIPEPLTFIIAVLHDETNYDVLDLDLYPNVLRNDFWSGRFEKILVGDLYKKQDQPQFEIMRDSTCIKNLGLDPEKADALIRKQLRLIRNTFDADEDLLLSGMEELEQQFASRRIERSYNRSIGTDLYPNPRAYMLDPHPKEYLRTGCPYLSNNIIYFTEQGTDRIRVIYWEWEEFSETGLWSENGIDEALFHEKFEALQTAITDTMGQPESVEMGSEAPTAKRFQNKIIWHIENGTNIRLSLFGNVDNNFRKLSLCIYRD